MELAVRRRPPEILLVGGQRCGSTTLHHHLVSQPGILPAVRKELHHFDFRHTERWRSYRMQFPRRPRSVLSVDATPYYLFHPEVPARAAAKLPGVRIVAVLRDPVARAVSHYHHAVRRGKEDRSMEGAFRSEADRLGEPVPRAMYDDRESDVHRRSYLRRGIYAPQLRRWLEHFPDAVTVLEFGDLFGTRGDGLAELHRVLGLAAPAGPPLQHRNAGAGRPADRRIVDWLTELFEPHDADLRSLLGEEWRWSSPSA